MIQEIFFNDPVANTGFGICVVCTLFLIVYLFYHLVYKKFRIQHSKKIDTVELCSLLNRTVDTAVIAEVTKYFADRNIRLDAIHIEHEQIYADKRRKHAQTLAYQYTHKTFIKGKVQKIEDGHWQPLNNLM